MVILVTGSAGYIGSTLVPHLHNRFGYWKIICVDNLMYGQHAIAAQQHLMDRVNFYNIDVNNITDLLPLLRSADIVIPLAAIVGAPACDKDHNRAIDTNYKAIKNIVAHLSSRQLLLFPQTNSGYGITSNEICTEESPMNPISVYGTSKCDAENVVRTHPEHVIFRLATVFGISPRMRLDLMVNNLVLDAVLDHKIEIFSPEFRRNFIHVNDVARAFEMAITQLQFMRGNIFNLGDDKANMTKGELGKMIAEITGAELSLNGTGVDPDKRDYLVSNAKLDKLNFKPKKTIQEGIKDLTHYYTNLYKLANSQDLKKRLSNV